MTSSPPHPQLWRAPLGRLIAAMVLLLALAPQSRAQTSVSGLPIDPSLLEEPWSAQWITHPEADGDAFGVYHFRRTFDLDAVPDSFIVHTTADNRYQLFVNGTRVRKGPARGEIPNWHFETTNLAPHLEPGKNVVAAVVWNFGEHRPLAQFSHETGFLLQGNDETAARLNTGNEWRVTENEAYEPIPRREFNVDGYMVVGPGERVDAEQYPDGFRKWKQPSFDDRSWPQAKPIGSGMPKVGPGPTGGYGAWLLVPRTIPRMESKRQRFAAVDRTENVSVPDGFVEGDAPLVLPAGTTATILLDQSHLTTAYPILQVSGGEGSRIKVTYAEALYDEEGFKRNRDVIEGKSIRGYHDVFLPDGGKARTFRPLWWRTFRYVQLDIETGPEPLRITDVRSVFTAYPFEERASFSSDDSTLQQIWDVSWRTARVCANETYVDTPYWEQLQYVGDTRIQALISLYMDGDDRLMRKALRAFNRSRISEGLTASRYPSHQQQLIPPYSLLWISMVHDYWMHRDDPAFVRSFLTPIRGVVEWMERHVDDSGLVGSVPWWNFVDWTYEMGVPPGAEQGRSVVLSLQFAYTLDHAADLAEAFDRSNAAQYYRSLADSLTEAARTHGWNAERGLLADTPEQDSYSQQANILGVLTGVFSEDEQQAVMKRVLADTSLTPSTYYFRFYQHRALEKAGLGHRYVGQLEPWRKMVKRGLTTTAEEPVPSRSDSHAWSAHPNYQLLSIVAGIRPSAPGFTEVRIEPSLGPLNHVDASMPHPEGTIRVRLERRGEDGVEGQIVLPEGVTGSFVWRGETIPLDGGPQPIDL